MNKILKYILALILIPCIIYLAFVVEQKFINSKSFTTVKDYIDTTTAIIEASPISIDGLRQRKIEGSNFIIEQDLQDEPNYKQYVVSYISESYKIYALLTIPKGEMPEGGYSAIIFNHGYIPPNQYKTTEKYVAYVDYLAKSGFVVLKPDLRGHGKSEGIATGTYFSNAYTIDVISALKSLQKDNQINPNKIGLWGHSMSGNLVLRSMLINDEFKAGVIWAGAVYSYEDFAKYGISDNSYRRANPMSQVFLDSPNREKSEEIEKLRNRIFKIDFTQSFWKSISLTQNLKYLNAPIQIHHAENDDVVDIGYSRDLKMSLDDAQKTSELYEYKGGGHNINSPYFEQAMKRTVEFFKKYL